MLRALLGKPYTSPHRYSYRSGLVRFRLSSVFRLDFFEEFYELYRADVVPRIREHTWPNKEYLIKSKIMPHFESHRMSEARGVDTVRWQSHLMDGSNNKGRGYTQTYLRTVNNQLSAILNHAARYCVPCALVSRVFVTRGG
ncbi:N-terminal phage integrase SAM-like domain-containing protein [Thermophilibacter immobilis]|uniref:Integrase SAM-like N-terminal domain-containing protein n=1 Tax=Thermophilibacter immobilis TaxID=2779519 RepID=A0A7S7M8I0_9ACTN|nr:N-terminal phage integrase SAM-like domain-containing protein [Thermophilibacter immobilis]QOY60412.1 hypothetical protein INP52_08395 [Thermophilibacter immobilis]